MRAMATLGHPTKVCIDVPDAPNMGADGSAQRTQSSGQAESSSVSTMKNLVSADCEQFLRIFKASEAMAEVHGRVGKQLTLFTERQDVCLGKRPEPGSRAPEMQQMKTVHLQLLSRDGYCKQDRDGRCEQRKKEPLLMTRGQQPALRMFCCSQCDSIVEYEMDGIPNEQPTSTKSVWNGFAIKVGFEQTMDIHSQFTIKSLPDFVHTLQAYLTPDSPSLAISQDMRLLARGRVSARHLNLDMKENPRIEISLVDKNVALHAIELPHDTRIQTLNFSHDSTKLLATMQDSRGTTTLVVWNTITGKEVRRIQGHQGATMMASFAKEGDRIFAASVYKQDKRLTCKLRVFFWNTSFDMSDTFRTDKFSITDRCLDKHSSFRRTDSGIAASWTSGDGSVKVFVDGGYEALGEQGSLLYHFATRSTNDDATPHRKDAVILDQKNKSDGSANSALMGMLASLKSGSDKRALISKGSISQDGSAFAHTFVDSEALHVSNLTFHIPADSSVLVWNLKCGELCHRFEHERSVTCVQVSTDARILLVGVSGFVADRPGGIANRLEQSALVVYSLITREKMWVVDLMHEILDAHLAETELLFEINPVSEVSKRASQLAVFAIPTSETTKFPCAGHNDDAAVTELRLLHDIEENLAVVTADELLDESSTTLTSYRSASTVAALESPSIRPRAALLPPPAIKPITSTQSWRSAAGSKRMVGLCISGDGLRYVAKWEGVGDGGQVSWLSVGDVDVRRGRMVHQENLQLLETGGGEHVQPESLGAFCMSVDGSAVACSIQGTCRVIVMHIPMHGEAKGRCRILWELDADVVPKALGVAGEKLSVMGDKDLQVSFVLKENIVLCYSLVTRVLLSRTSHKSSGRTLGIDGTGELRVSMSHEHRIFVERFASGQVLYEVFDSSKEFMGIAGNGNKVILKDRGQHGADLDCPCGSNNAAASARRKSSTGARERANHALLQVDITNFEMFGPSKETCGTWASSGEMESMFSVHKSRLSRWLLFDQVVFDPDPVPNPRAEASCLPWAPKTPPATYPLRAYPGRWSKLVSQLVRDKDYDSINLILEACPVMWACLVYTKMEDVMVDEPDAISDLFLQGLANNDRLLVQLLLEGAKNAVEEGKGVHCPVGQMECVTSFITACLRQSRMLDLVENFLKELPLIKVDECDVRKHVRSHFRRGRVISTGWGSRDAEALTGPWGSKDTTEEAEAKMRAVDALSRENEHKYISPSHIMERGYQYVVPLPCLCDQEFLELITAYQASPGLLDNESMRAAIRVLEADLQTRVLGLPLSGDFATFLLCLASFCVFVEFCITPVGPDGFSKIPRDEIWATYKGKAGVFLGAVSTLLNGASLSRELQKMANSKPIWTYIKPWNIIPWLSNLMSIISFAVFLSDSSLVTVRSTASFGMMFLWATTFTYLRTVRKLSALVNMLLEIMYDMSMFVVVMFVLVMSFAGGLYCLHGKILPETERPEGFADPDGTSDNVFLQASDSILRAFVMSVLQSFSEGQLRSPLATGDGGGTLTSFSYLFFFMLAFLVSVVGMNALIAIMNNSYTRVSESEHPVRDKEVASVMLDKLRNLGSVSKSRWQRQRRWIHVLSPSEKGSLLDRDNNGVVDQIKREIRGFETRQGLQLGHLQEILTEQEETKEESVVMIRELDSAVRVNVQESGSKQTRYFGMIKKVHEDQESVQTQVKALAQSVRSLERRFDLDKPDFAPLEGLPRQCEHLQLNLEMLAPNVIALQQDMARMATQMQNFEWHMQYRVRDVVEPRDPRDGGAI